MKVIPMTDEVRRRLNLDDEVITRRQRIELVENVTPKRRRPVNWTRVALGVSLVVLPAIAAMVAFVLGRMSVGR